MVSACLAGVPTRYDGKSRSYEPLLEFAQKLVIVPICPEILAGLGIPRLKRRFVYGDGADALKGDAGVIADDGSDSTEDFINGAQRALTICRLVGPDLILFKDGSPSCGVKRVDIEGAKTRGIGVTTALFMESGLRVVSEKGLSKDLLEGLFFKPLQ